MTVTVKGTAAEIAGLTGEEFTYYVDLSGIGEAGEYDMPILVRMADDKELEAVSDPSEIHVTVESPEQEEPEAPEEPEETETTPDEAETEPGSGD